MLRYTRLNSSACVKHNDDISCDGDGDVSHIYVCQLLAGSHCIIWTNKQTVKERNSWHTHTANYPKQLLTIPIKNTNSCIVKC